MISSLIGGGHDLNGDLKARKIQKNNSQKKVYLFKNITSSIFFNWFAPDFHNHLFFTNNIL